MVPGSIYATSYQTEARLISDELYPVFVRFFAAVVEREATTAAAKARRP